jgi:hypothetical protein
MPQSVEELVTFEVIPLVRAALKEAAELIGALQALSRHVEELTVELAEGEVRELRRLAAAALRAHHTTEIGGPS